MAVEQAQGVERSTQGPSDQSPIRRRNPRRIAQGPLSQAWPATRARTRRQAQPYSRNLPPRELPTRQRSRLGADSRKLHLGASQHDLANQPRTTAAWPFSGLHCLIRTPQRRAAWLTNHPLDLARHLSFCRSFSLAPLCRRPRCRSPQDAGTDYLQQPKSIPRKIFNHRQKQQRVAGDGERRLGGIRDAGTAPAIVRSKPLNAGLRTPHPRQGGVPGPARRSSPAAPVLVTERLRAIGTIGTITRDAGRR